MDTVREIHWVTGARKAFDTFPLAARTEAARALSVAAAGNKADNAKPLKGFSDGVFEIVLRHRGDAYRVVYAVKIGPAIWVVHAFQKKSTQGIKTPQREIDLIHERIKRLKEILR